MSSSDVKMTSAPPLPLLPPSSDIYISKSTASFHLVHMISSILQERGFSSCEAGVLGELEGLIEHHLIDLFSSIHTLAESAGRPRSSPSDIIEHLSLTYLAHLSPDILTSHITPPSPLIQGNSETWEQFEFRKTRARWDIQDEHERKMKAVVLESYEEPLKDYKKFMGRTRRRIKDGRVIERLPLETTTPKPPPADPTTLSLSDDESSLPFVPLPSFLPSPLLSPTHLTSTHPLPSSSSSTSTQPLPSTPVSQKRRRTSTLIKRDAFSSSLSTTTPTPTIRIKPEPTDDPSDLTSPSDPLFNVKREGRELERGQEDREIKVRENRKPRYMGDVAWVPKLPPRHRWRKTYETDDIPSTQPVSSGRLSTKTLEYLTSSSSSHPVLLDDKGRPQSIPHELAPVNYHSSKSPLSALDNAPSGCSNDPSSSSGSNNTVVTGETMDTPHAQGAGFSLGEDLFEGYVRSGGMGLYAQSGQSGQGGGSGKRKRWVVGPETRRIGKVG